MIWYIKKDCYQEAFLFYLAAGITDLLDGLAARAFNEESSLGTYLDPLADKFLVLSCLFFLQPILKTIPFWFSMLLLIRELLLIFGSIILYNLYGKTAAISPSILSKINTCLLLFLILIAFGHQLGYTYHDGFFQFLLFACTFFTLASTLHYIAIFVKKLQTENS